MIVRHPFPEPPEPGATIEVAPGILWARLPLPMKLDHVNVYLLDDGNGDWTLVDTGLNWPKGRAALETAIGGRRIARVIVTHHHPDHVGLAGWLIAQGADLWMPRTGWLMARMLVLDEEPAPSTEAIQFWQSAGMDPAILEKRRQTRPFNFADSVAPLPVGFRNITEGDTLHAGGRDWTIRMGQGHAPDHATLWANSGDVVLGGDQLLPGISPNISVYPTEPEADPLGGWLETCARLAPFATDTQLVLPGHKLPFHGLPHRLKQLEHNHTEALTRLRAHLTTPRSAADCFMPIFKRPIPEDAYGLALGEAYAHVAHLWHIGAATRTRREDGAWLWHCTAD